MIALYPDVLSIEQIRTWTHRLADLGQESDHGTPVATCGLWALADLLWHLTEVQHFWTFIINHRPDGPESYDMPERPSGDALVAALRRGADALVDALSDADPAEQAWSWGEDRTVGFSIRRQSHEALVHCIDGLLAAGHPIPELDPRLAADGVDEFATVMLSGVPSWARFDRTSGVIAESTDRATGRRAGSPLLLHSAPWTSHCAVPSTRPGR